MNAKLLIVEDEPRIARSIAQLANTREELEVVGIEINGLAAQSRLATEQIDVVITDINMPIMDGLQLASYISENHPEVITIILSGYQKFEYAQQAIGYRVYEYMLKPVTKEKIDSLLDRVVEVCAKRRLEKRHRVLARVVDGLKVEDGGVRDNVVIVASVGAHINIDSDLSLGQAFWNSIYFADVFLNELQFPDVFISTSNYNSERIVILQTEDEKKSEYVARALFGSISEQTSLPVTAAVKTQPVSLNEIGKTVRILQTAIHSEAGMCSSRMLLHDSPQKLPGRKTHRLPAGSVEYIVKAVGNRDKAEIKRLLETELQRCNKNDCTQTEFLRLLNAVVHDGRLAERMDIGRYEELQAELWESLANNIGTPGLAGDIASILLGIAKENAHEESKKEMEQIIDKVQEYLDANYMHSISTEMLSNMFGYVPSYLSQIFRRYKDISPSEYLVRYRVKKAKELMDTDTDILVKQVAELVGYTDQYYFSKIFKKETGIWPKEYQKAKYQVL